MEPWLEPRTHRTDTHLGKRQYGPDVGSPGFTAAFERAVEAVERLGRVNLDVGGFVLDGCHHPKSALGRTGFRWARTTKRFGTGGAEDGPVRLLEIDDCDRVDVPVTERENGGRPTTRNTVETAALHRFRRRPRREAATGARNATERRSGRTDDRNGGIRTR